MKRPFSPLVWLCAAGTLALGALTVLDPAGVYADYTASLGRDVPVLAAVFTAAQDGVYPWSAPAAPEAMPGPAYHPLTESVTDEEMSASVGNGEPFREPAQPAAPAEPEPAAEPEAEIAPAEDEGDGFIPVDEHWFDDALFIGDSHTEGFCDYAGLHNATYYYKRGVDV